jgi:hypothetical protein
LADSIFADGRWPQSFESWHTYTKILTKYFEVGDTTFPAPLKSIVQSCILSVLWCGIYNMKTLLCKPRTNETKLFFNKEPVVELSDLTFIVSRQVDNTYHRVYRLRLIDRHCTVVNSPSYVGG